MLEGLMNILDGLCMAGIGAIKGLLDAYGTIFYGITGAISKLGNLGKGVAVGGAIAVGGWYAAGTVAQQPPAQLLGQPAVATANPWANAQVKDSVTDGLPGSKPGDWTDVVVNTAQKPVDAAQTPVNAVTTQTSDAATQTNGAATQTNGATTATANPVTTTSPDGTTTTTVVGGVTVTTIVIRG